MDVIKIEEKDKTSINKLYNLLWENRSTIEMLSITGHPNEVEDLVILLEDNDIKYRSIKANKTYIFYFKPTEDELNSYSPGSYIYEITNQDQFKKTELDSSSNYLIQQRKKQDLLKSESNTYDILELNKYMKCNLTDALIIISKQRKSLQKIFVDEEVLADKIETVLVNHKINFERKTNKNESSFLLNQNKDKKYGYKHLRDITYSLKEDRVLPTYIYENGKMVKTSGHSNKSYKASLIKKSQNTVKSIDLDKDTFDDFSITFLLARFSQSLEKMTTTNETVVEQVKKLLKSGNIYFTLLKNKKRYTFYLVDIDLTRENNDEKFVSMGPFLSEKSEN